MLPSNSLTSTARHPMFTHKCLRFSSVDAVAAAVEE